MYRKHLAALAAAAAVSSPCAAFDSLTPITPGVMFYLSIPLEAVKAKDQTFSAGLAFQGRRDYETVRLDSRMINSFLGGGIEAKWLIGGVVAAGAVAAVASKDKSTTASQQQAQQAQATAEAQQQSGGGGTTCSKPPTCPN